MIHNHYKALVLKSEAEKYWKLQPNPKSNTTQSAISGCREVMCCDVGLMMAEKTRNP